MSDVFIVDGARTPLGGLSDKLSSLTANVLGSSAISAVIERTELLVETVKEVFMACVLSTGLKQCPARQAMLGAELLNTTGAVTLNKACGSGMRATICGVNSIIAETTTSWWEVD